ncbi:MAG: hypothetical protein AAGC81_03120 [Pseudomonadota bacterium]
MDLIADGLLVLAALVASLYCWVLSRRLRRLTQLDQGLGAAISSLSEQVEEMQTALAQSKESIEARTTLLASLTKEADQSISRLDSVIKTAAVTQVPAATPPAQDASPVFDEDPGAELKLEETVLELNEEEPELLADEIVEDLDHGILRVDGPAKEAVNGNAPASAEVAKEDEIDPDALASLLSLTKGASGDGAGALDRLLKALKRDVQEPST